MSTETQKRLWGVWGAFAAVVLMAGVLGSIDHTTGHHHHYGFWVALIGCGTAWLGNLLGRAAA